MKIKLFEGESIMKEMRGYEVPQDTLGVLYICRYNYDTGKIKIVNACFFKSPAEALNTYANYPNPESQVAYGGTREKFAEELQSLHDRLNNPKWVKDLANYL